MGHCLAPPLLVAAQAAARGAAPAKDGAWFGNPLGDGETSPEHRGASRARAARPPVLDVNAISRDGASDGTLTPRADARPRPTRAPGRRRAAAAARAPVAFADDAADAAAAAATARARRPGAPPARRAKRAL